MDGNGDDDGVDDVVRDLLCLLDDIALAKVERES